MENESNKFDKLEAGCSYVVEWCSKPRFRSVFIVKIHKIDEDGRLWYEVVENILRPNAPLIDGPIPSSVRSFKYECNRLEKITSERHLKKIKFEYKLEG